MNLGRAPSGQVTERLAAALGTALFAGGVGGMTASVQAAVVNAQCHRETEGTLALCGTTPPAIEGVAVFLLVFGVGGLLLIRARSLGEKFRPRTPRR